MRLAHVVRKEFIQFRRDRRMLPIVFVAPVLQLVVLGYAANIDVVDIGLAVCDEDRSPSSRQLVRSLTASGDFVETHRSTRCPDESELFERAEASMAVHIPPGFEHDLETGRSADILLTVDGSDSIPAGQGTSRALLAVQSFNEHRLDDAGLDHVAESTQSVELRQRVWFNPDLRSNWFFVPGILGLLLMLMTMLLTSMAIVKEKERGSIESIIVSPMRPMTLIAGKLVPFVIIGFVDVLLVTLIAWIVFRIPVRGSLASLLVVSLLFVINTTGLGLLVSTFSSTQQEAMMATMFFVMMPFMYLGDFVFPIDAMPGSVQVVTHVIPLRHFLESIRAIFLKGAGLADLWSQCTWLAGTGVAVFLVSAVRFRKKL